MKFCSVISRFIKPTTQLHNAEMIRIITNYHNYIIITSVILSITQLLCTIYCALSSHNVDVYLITIHDDPIGDLFYYKAAISVVGLWN